MLKARYNQNFPIIFELKNDNERYVTIGSLQLRELQAGKYHVRARYEGKNPGSPVAFTVKMPIKWRAIKVQ